MTGETRSGRRFKAAFVAAWLALPTAYVGGYLASMRTLTAVAYAGPGFGWVEPFAVYRPRWLRPAFAPAELIDRRIRPGRWSVRLVPTGPTPASPTQL